MIKLLIASLLFVMIGITILSFTRMQYKGKRYAIQNIQTGKNIRPYAAGKQDGNRLILYNSYRWKCMTWDLKETGENTYQLQNRYTEKTFQVDAKLNGKLNQIQLDDNSQEWEFIKQAENTYLIKQKETNLYISISSEETNSDIVLKPLNNTKEQLWRLVKQNPLL
ncbi:RICIN domain-containing protein [Chishuiella sp.]|uniref:RICIN domain-containing protein n=1 Tax=Chishuiella sp. TaxID=1969467 RepID=UPI0028B05A75|nr:RICIN domain-containing protein [Chishuiella sp.]